MTSISSHGLSGITRSVQKSQDHIERLLRKRILSLPESTVLVQTLVKLSEEKPVSFKYNPGPAVGHDFVPRVARALLNDLNVLRLEQKGSVMVSLRPADHVTEIEHVEKLM